MRTTYSNKKEDRLRPLIPESLGVKIKQLAREEQTTPDLFIIEVLEQYIMEHRNKAKVYARPAYEYDNREGDGFEQAEGL